MLDQLTLLIRAGNPLLVIETLDEDRACDLVRGVAKDLSLTLVEWSVTTGLTLEAPKHGVDFTNTKKPNQALDHLLTKAGRELFLFKDLGPHCRDAYVQRRLRDWCRRDHNTLITVETEPLPDPVRRLAVPLQLPLPDTSDLQQVVRDTFRKVRKKSLYKISAKISPQEMEQIVHTLRGLTRAEAARVIAGAIHYDYALSGEDLPRIVEAKRNLLAGAGYLESITTDVRPDDVGGLDNLKRWLNKRRGAYSVKAREFGLPSPRGILLLGVQGCGKSLCAKVVAADWHVPLLRMDPGVLYQKYIGESEYRLRRALQQTEAMAPVVLWIDEIEKAFASAANVSADGGLSQRMFGTLLTWMQDHRSPIFLVATANDISALPPELMRKGRFDEVFFIDLPAENARQEIWKVHLRRRRRDPSRFPLGKLAADSDGFSGAEIEQTIASAMYAAFSKDRDITTDDLLVELHATEPLSILMQERVAELRAWAKGRCTPAD